MKRLFLIPQYLNSQFLNSGLSELGYKLGGAFYAAPKTPLHSEEFSKRLLEEEHVCVLPLSELSSGSHEYFDKRVRISYGTDIDLLEEGLARFRRFAETIQSKERKADADRS